MSTIQQLMELGEHMGLQGAELRAFVKEQQDLARKERAEQLAYQREELMYQKEKEKLEAEVREKERRYELEKIKEQRKLETELRCGDQADAADERADVDAEDVSNQGGLPRMQSGYLAQRRGPKMPCFEEGKDSMDAYQSINQSIGLFRNGSQVAK